MQIFDNVNQIVKDDMEDKITKVIKVSIAVVCFSMYMQN